MAKDKQADGSGVAPDRRGFLKLAGLGAVASGATLVAGSQAKADVRSPTSAGYRETEHVKRFYETARF